MLNYKDDFPIFSQPMHGKPLVYLDSTGSSQKPRVVIDAIAQYYQQDHANVHRGVYELSRRATERYETARQTVQQFIHAAEHQEIIFTRGTTEAINLVASSWLKNNFNPGDEVIVSVMEHHSNIVPWQQQGMSLKVVPLTATGELDLEQYAKLFSKRTKLVSVTQVSNVLGALNPLKKMIAMAHAHGVPVLVDGAAACAHLPVDVQDLDCDFYVFSAHKVYGPTGLGVLYGKRALLERMPPYQTGGAMIEQVSFEQTTFASLPYKFEAGTPPIASAIGFQVALNYLTQIGLDRIQQHEQSLLEYAIQSLKTIPEIRLLGPIGQTVGVVSFVWDGIHPHDVATILDHEGICVRAGHHCAMPLMAHLQIPACVRVSLGLYNSKNDIDALITGLEKAKRIFA